MRCEEAEIRLDCLRTDELEADERRQVEAHLVECSDCRDLEREICSIADSARDLKGECAPLCLEALEESVLDRYDQFESGRGDVHVASSSSGIRSIRLGGSRESFELEHRQRFGRELHRSGLDEGIRNEIISALEGTGSGDLPLDLTELTEFEQRVLRKLLQIPRGEVRTYAWVAREVGKPAASRAVGNACARNPIPFVVPCHRVVPTSGGVGSYGYGPAMKRNLLDAEGVPVDILDELAKRGIRYVGSMKDRSYCVPSCRAVSAIADEDRLMLRDERQAARRGLHPCGWCRPVALSA